MLPPSHESPLVKQRFDKIRPIGANTNKYTPIYTSWNEKEKQCTVCSLLNYVVPLNMRFSCVNQMSCVIVESAFKSLTHYSYNMKWFPVTQKECDDMSYSTSLVTASLALVLFAFCCVLKFCNPRAQYTAKSSRRSSSARLKTSVSARAMFLLLTSWHTPIRTKQYVYSLNRLFSYQYHCQTSKFLWRWTEWDVIYLNWGQSQIRTF